jgi:thiosulfate dehydrogenase [quinone] large subunit
LKKGNVTGEAKMFFREKDLGLAFLILRLAAGMTFFMAGLNKLLNYPGVIDNIKGGFAETWMPDFLLNIFLYPLPFIELAVGALIVLGLFTRVVLILAGLLMLALNFGLLVRTDNAGAAKNIPYIIIIALDIMLINYNKYSLDNWFFGNK